MHLSLIVMTRNGSWRLERMLKSLAGRVDEIVVGVDAASDDDTEERARRYTDRVIRIDNPQGYIEPHIKGLVAHCTGDWILRLDDDELMSTNFSVAALPREALEQYDLIGFPRAWIVERNPILYIGTGSKPGELVPQFRLLRRAADWTFIDQIHTPGFEMKPYFLVNNMFIYHLNLIDQPSKARREKYDFYQSQQDAPWNQTYILDPRAEIAAGRAFPVRTEMFPPCELIRSTGVDYPAADS